MSVKERRERTLTSLFREIILNAASNLLVAVSMSPRIWLVIEGKGNYIFGDMTKLNNNFAPSIFKVQLVGKETRFIKQSLQ